MGAFDNYTSPSAAPSKSGGAFANYQPAAAPGAPDQPDSLGNMGWFDPRAANASTKDFMLAHLSELGKGLGQIGGAAADYGRVAANTFGQGDSTLASLKALYGDMTGNTKGTDYLSNLASAKADTAAASDRLGPAGTIAANMTGGGPLGEVAGAVKGMIPAAGRFAGPLAGAITGAGATAAGEAGRQEAFSPWDIGIGTVIGGGGGAPAGKGGALAPARSAADLKATAQDIYRPLDKIIFNASSEVKPELDAFRTAIGNTTDLTNRRLKLATGTSAILGDLEDSAQLTGRNIQEAQRSLDKIASSPSSSVQDQEYAPKLKAALQNVMNNGLPFAGVPANVQASGYAGVVQRAGDQIFGRFKNMETLDKMVGKSQVNKGPDLGSQVSSYLTSPKGQMFAKPPLPGAPASSAPVYSAFNNLAATAAKESSVPWWVKHFVIAPAAGLVINEGIQAATGEQESPLQHVGADLGIGGTLALGSMGYGKISGMRASEAQKRALNAARSTFSTGNYQAPVDPDQPFRDAVRQLFFSQGAAGRLPGQ
jgi:hypothetical protein